MALPVPTDAIIDFQFQLVVASVSSVNEQPCWRRHIFLNAHTRSYTYWMPF